jgi:hypothetical protein
MGDTGAPVRPESVAQRTQAPGQPRGAVSATSPHATAQEPSTPKVARAVRPPKGIGGAAARPLARRPNRMARSRAPAAHLCPHPALETGGGSS